MRIVNSVLQCCLRFVCTKIIHNFYAAPRGCNFCDRQANKKIWMVVLLLTFGFCEFSSRLLAAEIPAFPGAEGLGANTPGGRGGVVYVVNTLSDNPSDGVTFREACEASGPRYVVFAVSGHIRLSTTLSVNSPFITIAGQTSPGGVDVSGGMFLISTHDVIVQHMRFRMSSDVCDGIAHPAVGNCETYGDSVRIMGVATVGDREAYNVILDHCSISWGNDETLDIGGYKGVTRDVTISNCIIAQGLDDPAPENNHGYGISLGSKSQYAASPEPTDVTLHHNYIAHFRDRLPYVVYSGQVNMVNNVVYNWNGRLSIQIRDVPGYTMAKGNFIGNYTKAGFMMTGLTCGVNVAGIFYLQNNIYAHPLVNDGRGQFYVTGNVGCADDRVYYGFSQTYIGWLSDSTYLSYFSGTPHAIGPELIAKTMDLSYAKTVLDGAGAIKPERDSVDARFVADFYNGTGGTLADNHFPDNYPSFPTPPPPVDSDNDGMSDSWEKLNFGDLSQGTNGDYYSNGYNNIEDYFHFLAGITQHFKIKKIILK